jgi:hypothetical protein
MRPPTTGGPCDAAMPVRCGRRRPAARAMRQCPCDAAADDRRQGGVPFNLLCSMQFFEMFVARMISKDPAVSTTPRTAR